MKQPIDEMVKLAKNGELVHLDSRDYTSNEMLQVAAAAAGHTQTVVIGHARELPSVACAMILLVGNGAAMMVMDE